MHGSGALADGAGLGGGQDTQGADGAGAGGQSAMAAGANHVCQGGPTGASDSMKRTGSRRNPGVCPTTGSLPGAVGMRMVKHHPESR
ncbi:hypothetical protein GCM10022227_27310 [Streptomyces sedi]